MIITPLTFKIWRIARFFCQKNTIENLNQGSQTLIGSREKMLRGPQFIKKAFAGQKIQEKPSK
jgi:hypothetical protein